MSYHRSHSLGKVPFLWENQPGVCKVTPGTEESPRTGPPQKTLKLPPPPCSADGRKVSAHGLYVPLPPCPFQPTQRSSPKKGMSRTEVDPFLAAYLECTKSAKKQGKATKVKVGFEKVGLLFSCKHTCAVREDGMVRLPRLPEVLLKESKFERGHVRMGINSLKDRGY
ncbi:putative Glutamine synthetase [Cocos nucifera]|uniref:Putative Glutamine synthetase n=1 Tax=Cocos nucifera TaxID=13894 RepID=A0A8K0IEN4_COCNU|nr:putative Glutamine synthetase [Cocos nucifera]